LNSKKPLFFDVCQADFSTKNSLGALERFFTRPFDTRGKKIGESGLEWGKYSGVLECDPNWDFPNVCKGQMHLDSMRKRGQQLLQKYPLLVSSQVPSTTQPPFPPG
jgi:hypothetical protein